MARICPKCFAMLSEKANYCARCGMCMRERREYTSQYIGSESKTLVMGIHDCAIRVMPIHTAKNTHGKARILEAHQAYLDEKQRKETLEKELKELGNAILEERTTVKTDKYIALQKEIDKADREVNYWARRVADRITEYINMDNQTLIR